MEITKLQVGEYKTKKSSSKGDYSCTIKSIDGNQVCYKFPSGSLDYASVSGVISYLNNHDSVFIGGHHAKILELMGRKDGN